MKKIIFGIFAHPDDETFGPCGTLMKEASEGTELQLITFTSGEAGENPDMVPDLGAVRDGEWQKASDMIGASSKYNLKFRDGHLNNISMQQASERLIKIIGDSIASQTSPVEVEFMTFEPNGLTGHIDHIVAARVASFAFYTLKDAGLPLTKIRYYCNSEEKVPIHRIDWIYADEGRSGQEINEVIDARYLRDEIISVMRVHKTQRADCEYYLEFQGDQLGLDHFIVKS